MTISDRLRLADDPYGYGLARFTLRTLDRENRQVTFHFEDGSRATFNIRYEVAGDE